MRQFQHLGPRTEGPTQDQIGAVALQGIFGASGKHFCPRKSEVSQGGVQKGRPFLTYLHENVRARSPEDAQGDPRDAGPGAQVERYRRRRQWQPGDERGQMPAVQEQIRDYGPPRGRADEIHPAVPFEQQCEVGREGYGLLLRDRGAAVLKYVGDVVC